MLDKLAEHFQKNFYPDMDVSEVRAHLDNPEVLDNGMAHIAENGHDDPQVVAAAKEHIDGNGEGDTKPKPIPTPQITYIPRGDEPFKIPERQYTKKPVDKWTPMDYNEYDYDSSNGFAEYNKEIKDKILDSRKNASDFNKHIFDGGDSRTRDNRIYGMYESQKDENGIPLKKGHILFDKHPSNESFYKNGYSEKVVNNSPWIDYHAEEKKWNSDFNSMGKYFSETLPRNKMLEYLDSPQYKEVAKKTYGDKYQDAIDAQKERIKNVKLNTQSLPDNSWETGIYDDTKNEIGTKNKSYHPNPAYDSLMVHEFSHSTDKGMKSIIYGLDDRSMHQNDPEDIKQLNNKWYDFLNSNKIKDEDQDFKREEELADKNRVENYKIYLNNPTEIRARVNELRQRMIENKIDLNSPKIEEFIPNTEAYKQLQKVLPKEAIIKALRELAGIVKLHSDIA